MKEKRIKAIVVEDEIKIAQYLKSKIEYLNKYFVVEGMAENGIEALKLIELYTPDVVFTDISMPEMDGLAFIRKIHDKYPHIIVVIISGYSDFAYTQKAIEYGVFNYLLKPVDDNYMSETLREIRKNITNRESKKNRYVLCSNNNMFESGRDSYHLFLICVGNVIFDFQNEELLNFYKQYMDKINWMEIMTELNFNSIDWYVADESCINQKIIGIQSAEYFSIKASNMAEKIIRELEKMTGLKATIVYAGEAINYSLVWNETRLLRHVLNKKLVIGNSQYICLNNEVDRQNEDNEIIEMVKLKLNSYVRKYFVSQDTNLFAHNIKSIITYMIENHATQESLEKVCNYLLNLLEFSGDKFDESLIDYLYEKCEYIIDSSFEKDKLLNGLMDIFESADQKIQEYKNINMNNEIVAYVDKNYLSIQGQDEIAEHFGYNYTYLSRMFKQKAGKSMNKYITEKKIRFAKKLIESEEKLSFTEISDMCGYNDERYFSRVFKNETGFSPSDYRKENSEN